MLSNIRCLVCRRETHIFHFLIKRKFPAPKSANILPRMLADFLMSSFVEFLPAHHFPDQPNSNQANPNQPNPNQPNPNQSHPTLPFPFQTQKNAMNVYRSYRKIQPNGFVWYACMVRLKTAERILISRISSKSIRSFMRITMTIFFLSSSSTSTIPVLNCPPIVSTKSTST